MKTEDSKSEKVLYFTLAVVISIFLVLAIIWSLMNIINEIALMFNPGWTLLTGTQVAILLFAVWFGALVWRLIWKMVPE